MRLEILDMRLEIKDEGLKVVGSRELTVGRGWLMVDS